MQSPDDILNSGKLPNPLTDAQLIAGCSDPEELIYLSLGETWIPPAPGLIDALQSIPEFAHGYTLSPYGLPVLREALHSYISRTHYLADRKNWDVAVSQSGTRAAMSDFAQLLLARSGGKPCTALVPDPGWDYAGVFEPLGFTIRTYGLTAERNWQPDPDEVAQAITPGTVLVINTQNNPTGFEWTPEIVSRLIAQALETGTAILIDDAYYGLHAPEQEPCNALGILLDQLPTSSAPLWLAVRTMGKQFRSNGWGIGALTAQPETLELLVGIAHRRTYGCAVPLQAAMAAWLQNPESETYVQRIRQHYANNRDLLRRQLIDELGFPPEAVHSGNCTSYMRYRVPPRFIENNDEEHYRELCLEAGVLPGRGSMIDVDEQRAEDKVFVRIHLGHPGEVLSEALGRLKRAGLGW